QLALVLVAGEEVVLGLDRLVADIAALVALPEGAREPPRVVVRGADVAHLALAHQVVEGAQRLLERGLAIVPVRLVEIDVVRQQPAQRVLDAVHPKVLPPRQRADTRRPVRPSLRMSMKESPLIFVTRASLPRSARGARRGSDRW